MQTKHVNHTQRREEPFPASPMRTALPQRQNQGHHNKLHQYTS